MAFFQANFMLQTPHHHHDDHHHQHHHPPSINSILPSCGAPQDYHGGGSFLGKRSMSFSGIDLGGEDANNNNNSNNNMNGEDDLSDDGSQLLGEKKRRLNMEQVKTLEKSFELGNKLEPERKMQLARALGLQPRQIAIWFQNRRARWKTKQLEKDYDLLKKQYEAVKSDNDSLQAHNKKLQAEILALKNREPTTESINLNKETEGSCSNRSENSSEIKLEISRTPQAIDSPLSTQQQQKQQHQNQITSIPFFQSSISSTSNNSSATPRPVTTTTAAPGGGGISVPHHNLFHQTSNNSSRPEHHQHQHHHQMMIQCHQKMDHMAKEESLSNMFVAMDDQSGFWPWLEQQHFN